MSDDGDHERTESGPPAASIRARAEANPLGPMMTAPLSVEHAPTASGGPSALGTALNEMLRKPGLWRGRRLLQQANQPGGFVCPGCAFPAPDTPARVAVCEAGVRAIVDDFGSRVASPELFATYTIPELSRRSDHWLGAQGRLTHPMIRRADGNGYVPIVWDEALAIVGTALRELEQPDRAVFHASGRIANEPAYLLQLLARACGTNNVTCSSALSHAGSRVALRSVLGRERTTITLADFERAQAIFLIGHNPGSTHPRMLELLRRAKLRGAKLVAINPLREVGLLRVRDPKRLGELLGAGTALADIDLRVRIGGDAALFEGLCKAVIEAGAIDRSFIDAHTEGFAAFAETVRSRTWAEIVAEAGVDEPAIRAAADIYAGSSATIACWGLGLTQHVEGVATIERLLALLLLRGNVDRPGAGALPLLGQANTAGSWALGLEGQPGTRWLDALERSTGLTVPRTPGPALHEAVAAMRKSEVDVFLGLGGNLLSSMPDTERVAEGLRRCRLTVHVATKLNRSHLITGEVGLLLPCIVPSERDAEHWSSFTDMTGNVRASRGRERPISDALLAEVEILARIGATARPDVIDWSALAHDRGRIRELIAALPDCDGFARLTPEAPQRLGQVTADKAQFRVPTRTPAPERPEPGLWLTTVRSHDQLNSTVYSVGDRERGLLGYRRVLLMNLDDMHRLGVEPYSQIDLVSHHRGERRVAPKWVAIPHHVHEGCAAAYWPEANVLVPSDAIDPRSGTPGYKSVWVTIGQV
jgi:molybdopterin-dependent oxidoreductase alpha subunit